MRKGTLLMVLGIVILGLISGLFLHGPAKENNMDSKGSIVRLAEPAGVDGHPGAFPQKTETATFAMG